MTWYVDTSALLAFLDGDDRHHARAVQAWEAVSAGADSLVTSSYVVVETSALVQRRLGMVALRALHEDVLGAMAVHFVTPDEHLAGATALLRVARRQLSLVDCVSFEVMRRRGLREAFAYDRHFRDQGFVLRG